MTSPAADDRPLPAARAFVVQLRASADVVRGHWAGRVVHVVSGASAPFETLEELMGFVDRTLAGSRADGSADA